MLAQQHDIWVCGPACTYGYSLADRGLQWLKIAEEITTEVIQESLVQILGAVQWTPPVEGALPILVVNPLSWTRSEVAHAELLFDKGEWYAFSILDATGKPVAAQTAELSLVLGYSGLFIYTTSEEFHRMRGEYHYKYSLLPHGRYDPAQNNRQALEASNPLLALRMNRWPTTRKAKEPSCLPEAGTFFTLDAPSGIISTVRLEQGQPVIRLYEDAGQTSEARLYLHWPKGHVSGVTGAVRPGDRTYRLQHRIFN